MRRKTLLYLSVFLMALLLCTPVMAKTVCKIGSKGYSSLQEAINNVKDGQTIKVTKSITTDKMVSTWEGEKSNRFTIDFRGKKYTYTGTEEVALALIPVKGTTAESPAMNVVLKNLNMVRKGSEGKVIQTMNYPGPKRMKVTVKSGRVEGGQIQVHESATVNIKGGTFVNGSFYLGVSPTGGRGDLNISGGTFQDFRIHSKGNVTITGGTFTSKDRCIYNEAGGLIIKGGKFTSDHDIIGTKEYSYSHTRIYNGTFKPGNNSPVLSIMEDAVGIVNGGTFKGFFYSKGKLTISGGKSTAPVIVDKDGYCLIKKFTIKQDDAAENAMLINESDTGKFIVTGGKFVSKNGVGYKGKIIFNTSGDYKKLFDVKKLTEK